MSMYNDLSSHLSGHKYSFVYGGYQHTTLNYQYVVHLYIFSYLKGQSSENFRELFSIVGEI
jgi:hypothetical protein